MKTKTLVIVALLAFAAGGTCPSDVNNDGTVGIQDFLQVLGAWGPCPAPTVIATENYTHSTRDAILRQWSDGKLELLLFLIGDQWIVLEPAPASPHMGQPVDISLDWISFEGCSTCNGQGEGVYFVIRQYADGYAERTRGELCNLDGNQDLRIRWFDWEALQEQFAEICR